MRVFSSHTKRLATIACVLACAWANSAFVSAAIADILRLKSGGSIEGAIVKQDAGRIEVRTRVGMTFVNEQDIESIERKPAPWEVYRERSASIARGDAGAHWELARFCLEHDLKEEAVAELREALRLNPDFTEARDLLATLINPSATSLLNAADRFAATGDRAEARKLWQEAIERFPESRFANVARARLASDFAREGEHARALELWQEILATDPTSVEAYFGVAAVAEKRNLWQEAASLYARTLSLDLSPQQRESATRRQTLCNEMAALWRRLEDSSDDPALLVRQGRLLLELGHVDAAVETYAKAVLNGSRDADALTYLARYYSEQYDIAPALQCWQLLADASSDKDLLNTVHKEVARLEALSKVPLFLAARTDREQQALLEEILQAELPYEPVVRMAAKGPRYDPAPAGLHRYELPVGLESTSIRYVLYVPESYDASEPRPLLVALHPLRTEPDEYIGLWRQAADENGFLVIAPYTHNGEWFANGNSIVHAVIQDAIRHYCIDSDRIWMVGASLGGEGALQAAPLQPDLFAAIAILASGIRGRPMLSLSNLRNVPVYMVHGARDDVVPIDIAREVAGRLRQAGCDAMLVEMPHAGHSAFAAEWRNVIQWFLSHPRNRSPRRVSLVTASPLTGKAYWVRAVRLSDRTYDPDRLLRIELPPGAQSMLNDEMIQRLMNAAIEERLARIDAAVNPQRNVIELATRNVLEVEVLLNDELVDMARPITIVIDGQKVFEGIVPRSAAFTLRLARRTGDSKMLFAGSVRVAVPGR